MTTEERATRANDDIRLLSFGDVCDLLNVSAYTLNKWIRQGVFPQPIYMTPTSPRQFRYRDIANHLEKRRRSRPAKREPRGVIKDWARRARGEAMVHTPRNRKG
jgi:predicted DNA-binding transcriptional regulator AlpA